MNEYHVEDAIMETCEHEQHVILYDRLCVCCGKQLESEVIEPGTNTLTKRVSIQAKP